MKFITINDLKTRYIVSGRGHGQVLFLHGWAASARMWLRSMWALRHQHRLWAIDLPGFGSSDTPDVDWYSIENYSDHVAAFCAAVGIDRLDTLVGHSMGGRIALDIARRYPHLVGRLVLVAPTVTGRLGFNLDLLMAGRLSRVLFNLSRWAWPVATAGAMSTYWAPRFLGSEGVRRTADDMRRTSWAAAMGALRAVARQDYSPYLAEIAQPALVICGARDYTVPPRDSRRAARSLCSGRLVMMEGVHHWPPDEAPETFLQTLSGFMNEHNVEMADERAVAAFHRD
ncbi:MAG: alpha/beta hydrolase [Anaerolineae bacterium]